MKGEDRIDLNKIAVQYYKLGLLLSDFFKKEDLNEVAFRDLYDFCDSPNINYHCYTDCAMHNGKTYWTHNIERENGKAHNAEFETRRDAEVDMFLNVFRNYEKLLNPVPDFYHRFSDKTVRRELYGDTTADGDFMDLPF